MITIRTTSDQIQIESPYNSEFISRARDLGGRWSGSAWAFDIRDEEAVRQLCLDVHGTDGRKRDLVDIQITFHTNGSAEREAIQIGGRPIARAQGRDSGARLCDGVVLKSGGGFGSGGSRANWQTTVYEKSVIEVRDFPRSMIELINSDRWLHTTLDRSCEFDVVIVDRAPNRDSLLAERDALVARLAEIDALLAK